jgi:hypothetical protein
VCTGRASSNKLWLQAVNGMEAQLLLQGGDRQGLGPEQSCLLWLALLCLA